jgi:hypothetical protein
LYSSSNIIRIINSRRIRWAGHVEHVGKMRNKYKILIGKPVGKRLLGRPGADRIILKWILKKQGRRECGLIWLRIGTGGGFL